MCTFVPFVRSQLSPEPSDAEVSATMTMYDMIKEDARALLISVGPVSRCKNLEKLEVLKASEPDNV